MATNRNKTKENVFPHSQAKLDLYRNYLLHYLKVLGLTPYCSKINLFDIFCGIGKYKDGNIGSPLITNNSIKETNKIIKKLNRDLKPISIIINDKDKDKIDNVQKILDSDKVENCSYDYYNIDANSMLDVVANKVNFYGRDERSLIFIDPYGYSNITGSKIYDLIKNEHTEIILFLPVMQMYRFADAALSDIDRACYEDLRNFIFSFFPESHKIHNEKLNSVFEFITEIKKAISFENRFYTCSHYIERGKNNYYALFFITSNLYGLDKMVEAKWKLDPIKGKGFTQKKIPSLFDTEFEELDKNLEIEHLRKIIIEFIIRKKSATNAEVYKLTLLNEFQPKHARSILNELIKNKSIVTFDKLGIEINTNGDFYLDYTNYKTLKNLIYFKLK